MCFTPDARSYALVGMQWCPHAAVAHEQRILQRQPRWKVASTSGKYCIAGSKFKHPFTIESF